MALVGTLRAEYGACMLKIDQDQFNQFKKLDAYNVFYDTIYEESHEAVYDKGIVKAFNRLKNDFLWASDLVGYVEKFANEFVEGYIEGRVEIICFSYGIDYLKTLPYDELKLIASGHKNVDETSIKKQEL